MAGRLTKKIEFLLDYLQENPSMARCLRERLESQLTTLISHLPLHEQKQYCTNS